MPVIYLNPGETLKVRFNGDNEEPADGEFTIEYSAAGDDIKVSESAGLEGSVYGRALQVLYHERYEPDDSKPAVPISAGDEEELAHQAEERGEARIRKVEHAKKLRRELAKLVDKDVLDGMLPKPAKKKSARVVTGFGIDRKGQLRATTKKGKPNAKK